MNQSKGMILDENAKQELLRIARQTLEASVKGEACSISASNFPLLEQKLGAFVTLTIQGQLRGCIGNFEPDLPVWEVVREMASAAALEDPRFVPVHPEELSSIRIEISVLSPRTKIQDISEILVGEHGLYIRNGWHSGTLLPQVATEYGWDVKTFLRQTCVKAGMSTNAWEDPGTDIFIYSAIIFHEP